MNDESTKADRISLGTFPALLKPAPRMAVALGLEQDRFWINRDDLTVL
ncbi:MAG: hypothetical protein ACRDN0_09215 [Trebonia sp.]